MRVSQHCEDVAAGCVRWERVRLVMPQDADSLSGYECDCTCERCIDPSLICRCGHVVEDHVPMDICSSPPCARELCPCLRFTESR